MSSLGYASITVPPCFLTVVSTSGNSTSKYIVFAVFFVFSFFFLIREELLIVFYVLRVALSEKEAIMKF